MEVHLLNTLKKILFDVNKREFTLLFILVLFTVILGIYPSLILDTLHYGVINFLYLL